MRRRRHRDSFSRSSMVFSTVMHAAIFAIGWLSTLYEPPQLEFVTYEIELVSPPPTRQAPEPQTAREELVVERPDPDPTPPEPEVEEVVPVEEPEPDPEPPPAEDPAEEEPPEAADEPTEAATEEATEEEEEVSGEDLNVRIEGLQRDYPAYYDNIIRQIDRCFRWREGGGWETEVFFYITRSGGVEEIDFLVRSGNRAFDFRAYEAVECAGRDARFGPLPEDLPYERFPVRFSFRPRGAPEARWPAVGEPAEAAGVPPEPASAPTGGVTRPELGAFGGTGVASLGTTRL